MNPAVIAALVSLVEEAVKDTPALIAEFQTLFQNNNPTPADWQALKDKYLSKGYKDYVPDSAIPNGQ